MTQEKINKNHCRRESRYRNSTASAPSGQRHNNSNILTAKVFETCPSGNWTFFTVPSCKFTTRGTFFDGSGFLTQNSSPNVSNVT